MPTDTALIRTRHALHAVAEQVLAGSQYAACSRIALRVIDRGFATRYEPDLRVEGGELVSAAGRVAIDGRTPRELAGELGTELRTLEEVYADGAEYGPDQVLHLDPGAVAELTGAWSAGCAALLEVAPGSDPILWPEHFDVGISLGEVNLGVSPGDGYLPAPYAYVGPWQVPESDAFFDAPFGAARLVSDLGDVTGIAAFFAEGLARL